VFTTHALPNPDAYPFPWAITTGPDGALWFTESNGDDLGRITTAGTVSEQPVPTTNADSIDITVGPDNNLWFAENIANQIAKVTL
jgi:virginiamycin B lyase